MATAAVMMGAGFGSVALASPALAAGCSVSNYGEKGARDYCVVGAAVYKHRAVIKCRKVAGGTYTRYAAWKNPGVFTYVYCTGNDSRLSVSYETQILVIET
ncbi:hypothetical protein [Actinoplanes subglobosus]|uniref:Secreted protein n=1 Tax=Actinoplanes subglobosus TaxID=1547892 RepID=A0ABV8J9H0_9ACTN